MVQRIPNDRFGANRATFAPGNEEGGTVNLLDGKPGSGKTSVALQVAEWRAAKGSACIWRGAESAQWKLYPGDPDDVKVWVEQPWSLEVRRVDVGDDEGEPIPVETHGFETPQELVHRIEDGTLNVVYAKERDKTERHGRMVEHFTGFWADVTEALRWRDDARWIDLFVDEAHEVLTSKAMGEHWHANHVTATHLAQFRKTLTCAWLLSHADKEIWEEFFNKADTIAWFRNDRVGQNAHDLIQANPQWLRDLGDGEFILDSKKRGAFTVNDWVPDVPRDADVKRKARLYGETSDGDRVHVRDLHAIRADDRWHFAMDWLDAKRLYDDHDDVTQQDIADAMGCTRQWVSQQLQDLEDQGVHA